MEMRLRLLNLHTTDLIMIVDVAMLPDTVMC